MNKNNSNHTLQTSCKTSKMYKQLYENLFNISDNAVSLNEIVFDSCEKPVDFKIIDINPAFEELFNVNKETFLNFLASEFFILDKPEEIFGKINTQAPFTTKLVPLKLNMELNLKISPVDSNYFLMTFSNGTPLKTIALEQALIDLENSNIMLQAITDTALDAIIMIDDTGKITFWNKAAEKILGFSEKEILSKDLHEILVPEQYRKAYTNGLKIFKETGEGRVINNILELSSKKKDGSEIIVELSVSSLKLDNKWHAVGILRDITDRKTFEAALHKSIRELRDKEEVLSSQYKALKKSKLKQQEAFDEIKKINLQLKKAHSHKDRFLSTMSHELRTPLNAILGFTEALEKQYFGELNPKQLEYTSLVYNSGQHLLSIINDILDITKIDAGTMDFRVQEISPYVVAEDIINIMKNQFEKKEIQLIYNASFGLPSIEGDIQKCKQVMLNLVTNALKYTKPGGIVEVNVEQGTNNKVIYTVKDNGIGIQKKDLDQIFNDFYQTDYTKKYAISGTGIGLALCKRLVKMHNGEIGVESEIDKGSTFWFTIPVYRKFS